MTTAADHLRAQSIKLRDILDNTPIEGEAVHAVNRARRIIDIVASDLACEKVRIVEPTNGTRGDARALRLQAQEWRDLADRCGPSFALQLRDLAAECEVQASAIERALPRRPWARYAIAGLVCYLAGAATAAVVLGAL